jgi:hypothetical protein
LLTLVLLLVDRADLTIMSSIMGRELETEAVTGDFFLR